MRTQSLRLRAAALVIGVTLLAFSGAVSADPPSRVARLGYMSGEISFSPGGESYWYQAAINRPLTNGDRLWADTDARAEIQVGGAMIRMNGETGVSVLNLDDRITQLQLTQGTLNVSVRRLDRGQVFEVDTPNLAFALRKPGEYRIEVDPDGHATTIIVRVGQGEVYGDGAAYTIDSRQPYRFTGTDLSDYEYVQVPRLDEFDRWSSGRDRNYDNSKSARYVSQDVVGYQDLDANGTWRVDAAYGNVWVPNRVADDWAPYRDGHWAWVDPWGWTWVDNAPWGFAVSHYGRWANMRGTWGWVPGPVRTRAYYAPALVAFVGGSNFQLTISSGNVGGVAWFPLAPREVYRPSYKVSRGYFEGVNRSNTVVNNTVINNTYNNTNVTNVTYINRAVPGAVVAMPAAAFAQSQPVPRAAQQIPREKIVNVPVVLAPPVAPTEKSVRGAAPQSDKPPPRVFERAVVAHTAPPAAQAGFAAQQRQLATQPGKPLDKATREELKPTASAPVVKVAKPTQGVPSALSPPPATREAKPEGGRVKSDERKPVMAPAMPQLPDVPDAKENVTREERKPAAAAPAPAVKVVTPTHEAAPAVGLPPAARETRLEDQRVKPDDRKLPAAPATPPRPNAPDVPKQVLPPQAAPSPGATKHPVVPAQATPPVLTAPTPVQREKPEPRTAGEKREQVITSPPSSQGKPAELAPPTHSSDQRGSPVRPQQPASPLPAAQRVAEPKAIAPHVVPPAPTQQAPPQRPIQSREAPPKMAPPPPAAQQPVPDAGSHAQNPKRDAGKPNDREKECVEPNCDR